MRVCCSCGVEFQFSELKINVQPGVIHFHCDLCHSTLLGEACISPEKYPVATPKMVAQAIRWMIRV